MKKEYQKYVYLLALCLIWGSSFILIKKALGETQNGFVLKPEQMGSLRLFISTIILSTVGIPRLLKVSKSKYRFIFLSGLAGSFFPAFLFAFAQTKIDSAIAGILNSVVPLLTIIIGYVAFKIKFTRNQLLGVVIGLVGGVLLVFAGKSGMGNNSYLYAGLVLIASTCYACNVNIVKRYLQEVDALATVTGNFIFILPLTLAAAYFSNAFAVDYNLPEVKQSLVYLVILCIFGTVIAKVIYNKLVQLTSPVFASTVTYLMPIVSVIWGLLDGEQFNTMQFVCMAIILLGVLLVTRKSAMNKTS